MTRYDLLNTNRDLIFQLVKASVLSYHIIRDMEIFEKFKAMDSVEFAEARHLVLADEFELSKRRVEDIIYNMKQKV